MSIKLVGNKGKQTYNVYKNGEFVATFRKKKDAKAFKKYLRKEEYSLGKFEHLFKKYVWNIKVEE